MLALKCEHVDNPLWDKWEKFSGHQLHSKARKNSRLGNTTEDVGLSLSRHLTALTVFNVALILLCWFYIIL